MAHLSQRDFRAILEFVDELYAPKTIDAYKAKVVDGLPRIIPSDVCCVFSESNPQRRSVQWVSNTAARIPNSIETFVRHMHEFPFIRHWNAKVRVHKAVKLSDLVSRREWCDRAIYSELYRPSDIEHILAVSLRAARPRELHVGVRRKTLDFDERDRLALDLLSPHLSAAYEKAEAMEEVGSQLGALLQGLEAAGRSVVSLGPGSRIRQMSERAQHWLMSYFNPRWSDRTMLPPALDEWLRRQPATTGSGDLGKPRRPFVVERHGKRLTVQVLSDRHGLSLLLSERKLRIEPEDLASLGLSRRETEVLAWLTGGKTNRDIADILDLSPITIKHCVERILAKLDVPTRAAATAIAVATADAGD
jgi:DNA-binding CsgD family transcriptional regulator